MANDFFIRAYRKWSWAGLGGVRLPMSVQGQNSGKFSEIFRNIPILRYIGLIKMLFSSVTKVEPLVLKWKFDVAMIVFTH